MGNSIAIGTSSVHNAIPHPRCHPPRRPEAAKGQLIRPNSLAGDPFRVDSHPLEREA